VLQYRETTTAPSHSVTAKFFRSFKKKVIKTRTMYYFFYLFFCHSIINPDNTPTIYSPNNKLKSESIYKNKRSACDMATTDRYDSDDMLIKALALAEDDNHNIL